MSPVRTTSPGMTNLKLYSLRCIQNRKNIASK
jgi:hypothetical protein